MKLPIEPLPEQTWARVEDRVVSAPPGASHEPEPRRWGGVALGGAALAVAVVAIAIALWPGAPQAHLTTVSTDAASAELALGEVTLEVAPDSELSARGSDAAGWDVRLARGAVTCEVPAREGRPPLRVHAGGVRVEVVGTRFTVRRDPALEVTVERGVVRVVDGNLAVELAAGERWPRAAEPGRQRHGPGTDPDPGPEPEPDPNPDPVLDLDLEPEPDPAALFSRAAALERTAPDRADALYARIERAGGPWAANALFARARLDAERGRDPRARRALERYLRRYPGGPNAADARRLQDELEER